MTATLPDPTLVNDAAAFEGPLFDAFAAVAERQPRALAVDDGSTRLTYAELRDRALALGAHVAARVPLNGLVGVVLPTIASYPVAWLACLAARRPFLPLDPYLPAARKRAIVAEAGLAAVIVLSDSEDLAAWMPAALPRIPVATDPGTDLPRLPAGLPPSGVGMVLFTSGSTGRAKGIALHERSALRNAVLKYRMVLDPESNDRVMSLHPPSTTSGVGDAFGTLLYGASLHLVDLKRDGLTRVLAVLRGASITLCAAVPVVARALMAIDGAAEAFGTLRVMRLSGDAVMGSDIHALARLLAPQARILIGFGLTEVGGMVTQRLIDPGVPIETGRINVGLPTPDQIVTVQDANGTPVKPGETGEMVVRGRYLALGHWVAGGLDPTEFPPDPSTPGTSCFRSGDMVLLRDDGTLVPIGRADRQVKINGSRIQPGDTEAALRGLPGVADAAVLVHGDADAPMLVGFVVSAPEQPVAQSEAQFSHGLRSVLAALLPPQQVPAQIRVVPAIPLLPSLKPDLGALRALLATENAPGVLGRIWTKLRGSGARRRAARIRPAVRRDGPAP